MNFFKDFESAKFEIWKAESEKALKGKPFEKLFSSTLENIKIKPIYTKEDSPDNAKNEFPGFRYFLRSWKIDGNRIEPWKIIQRIETPNPKDANQLIKNEIDKGVDGFVIKHYNYNLENPKGVVIDSLLDLEDIFNGVDLSKITIHFDTLFPVELCSILVEYFKKTKTPNDKIDGSVNLDFFESFLDKGKFFEQSFWLDNILWKNHQILDQNFPKFKTFVIDGTIFYESGSNIVQEIAFTLNLAVEKLKFILSKTEDFQNTLNKFMFKISIGSDIFLNLAKLRSLRFLWSTILESLGIDFNSVQIPIYAVTAKRNKSKLDAYVNMLRNTCETLTAILGTADYIEVTPYDYFLNEPEEFSIRNARNTQLVLKEEHNLREVIDPVGGSWFLETLTYEITQKALELFKEIEQNGGFYKNLINGNIQNQILKVRNKRMQRLSTREDILVGTNRFSNPDDNPLDAKKSFFDYKEFLETKQKTLTELPKESKEQAFGFVMSSISSHSPFTSIQNSLIDIPPLKVFRETEEFENLRTKSLQYKSKFGKLPQVGIIPFGKIANFKERLDFVVDFFLLGGFDVKIFEETESLENSFQRFFEFQPPIVVFCSTNEEYMGFAPKLATLIKKAKPLTIIILAGLPAEQEIELFKQSGVDEFIHIRTDVLKTLNNLYSMILVD